MLQAIIEENLLLDSFTQSVDIIYKHLKSEIQCDQTNLFEDFI